MKISSEGGKPGFRHAQQQETAKIMGLIEQAKRHLKQLGVDQWQKGYPDSETIRLDISERNGYVLTIEGDIAAYACISFDGEVSYRSLNGTWLSQQPYAVIHRLAVGDTFKGRGLSARMLKAAEALCVERGIHSIKVDTDENNAAMKHILLKNGFTYCGLICFDNSDKIAFEKLLQQDAEAPSQ